MAAVWLLPITTASRWAEPLKEFTSLSCVNNGEAIPASGVSVSSDAAVVGTPLKSVLKMFLLEGKLAGDLDQVVGLTTCERSLFGHWTKAATAAGIDARDTWFCLQSVTKSKTTLKQAQELATRHEMEE